MRTSDNLRRERDALGGEHQDARRMAVFSLTSSMLRNVVAPVLLPLARCNAWASYVVGVGQAEDVEDVLMTPALLLALALAVAPIRKDVTLRLTGAHS